MTHPENEKLADLTLRERLVFAPLLVLIFWMGVMPQPFIERMQPALERTLILARERAEASEGLRMRPGIALLPPPTSAGHPVARVSPASETNAAPPPASGANAASGGRR